MYMSVVEELKYACLEMLKGRRSLVCRRAEFWMNSGSAAEGSFGRRTSCMVAWLPQPVLYVRLCLGDSAAEGAAEGA